MDKQRDFVLRTIEERGVKFVRLWFTDVIGTLRGGDLDAIADEPTALEVDQSRLDPGAADVHADGASRL